MPPFCNPCVCVCVFEMQKQYDSPCLLCEGTEILWKFHSGLHGLIIIVYVATRNALAKVTSLQGTDEEETERKEKVSREIGTEDSRSNSNESCQVGALTDLTEFLSTLASVSHRWCPSIDRRIKYIIQTRWTLNGGWQMTLVSEKKKKCVLSGWVRVLDIAFCSV